MLNQYGVAPEKQRGKLKRAQSSSYRVVAQSHPSAHLNPAIFCTPDTESQLLI